MSRYASVDCPICKKTLENGEEIVVCPECGAPYHKSCYQREGHCVYTELHEKGESWEAPKKEEKYDGQSPLRCPRCGTVNPVYGIFCQVCGGKLNDKATDASPNSPHVPPNQPGYPPFGGPMPFGGPGMPPNPFSNPFGGVAPDEEIDGIPAKDLAIFVGKNSHYYLPHFKAIAVSKAKSVNWSAFFFEGGFFLYRKMYGWGILFLLIILLLEVPNALMMTQMMQSADTIMSAAQSASMQNLSIISYICSFLSIALRVLCGFLANPLYKAHCVRKINQEKQVMQSQDEYYAAISKKGSVAFKLVVGLLIAYMLFNMVLAYMLILTGGIGGF